MNRDDIIRMAREAGMIGTGEAGNELERLYREAILDALPRFAALVAAAERDASAKVCGDMLAMTKYEKIPQEVRFALYEAENAIRARGQG